MADQQARILVVDDDRLILAMLTDMLAPEYEVVTAADGARGLQALEAQPFAAILCDQHMPGLSGVEVLERAITLQPDAARILVTATDEVKTVAEATNVARVHRVVVKPVRQVEIKGILKGALREISLEAENRRLLEELRARERELEHELTLRNEELREAMRRLAGTE